MPIPPLRPSTATFHDIVTRSGWGIMLARETLRGVDFEPSAITAQGDIARVGHNVERALKLDAPTAAKDHANQALTYLNKAYDTLAPFAAQDPDWPSRVAVAQTESQLSQAAEFLGQASEASK